MRFSKGLMAMAAAVMLPFSSAAQAAEERLLCVFDILGSSGDVYNVMKDYAAAAQAQGYALKLKAYTDENIAAEDLKANQCDMAAITGIRGKHFNTFTGSMDSIGSMPNYDVTRMVMQVLGSNNPKIKESLRGSSYEIMGVMPAGATYLFVKDHNMNTVNHLAGKSISVLEYDVTQARMAASVGMTPVMSDISNFAGRFNNHSVDICFAPAMAYAGLELYKGMEPNGGVVDYVLGQLSIQLIARNGRFGDEFGDWSRSYFGQTVLPRAMRLIEQFDAGIPEKWWIRISDPDRERYDEMMRDARVEMTKEGLFNKEMMTLLRNIRCRVDGGRAECSDRREIDW